MISNKKILIISAAFYPSNSPRANRTTELAKELARQGHYVTLLIPKQKQDYSLFEKEYNLVVKDLGGLRFKEIRLGNSPIAKVIERALFRVMLSLFEYPYVELMLLVRNALQFESGYDLLISIAVPYPVHWGVLLTRNKKHLVAHVWVADCGDPFTGFEKSVFYKAFYLKMLTTAVFAKCDFITVPFNGAVNAYPKKFRSKIRIIPQGFNLSEVEVFNGEISHPVPTFGYAGSFIPGRRDPRPFIEFLLENKYSFQFNIYTTQKMLFSKYPDIIGSKLILRDFVDRQRLLFELSKMNFLINFNNGNEIQLPSKIIDYALTGRPVLSIDSFHFNKNIVKAFLSGDYTARLRISLEDYNIKNIAQSFINIS